MQRLKSVISIAKIASRLSDISLRPAACVQLVMEITEEPSRLQVKNTSCAAATHILEFSKKSLKSVVVKMFCGEKVNINEILKEVLENTFVSLKNNCVKF